MIDADESVATCFERVVERHRFGMALGGRTWQPSYDELNATANRLAHALNDRGGAPGDRIAVLMESDTPLFAAVLAVIKTGRIVVVFNPTDPPARLRQLAEDAEPRLIVADAANRDLAAEIASPGCDIVSFENDSAAGPAHNPAIHTAPDQTLALVYTSGTTGRPKGVMMTHRRILHAMVVDADMLAFSAADRIPLLGPMSHGAPFTRSWRILLNGATLYPFPILLQGVTGLADWMIEHGATVYMSSASIFRSLMSSIDDGVRFPLVHTVWLSAEPATADDFRHFRKHFSPTCGFIHTLASTEAGNIAISRRYSADDVAEGRLSVGPVSKGMDVLILNGQDQPVAPGEVGEIVVKSRGLAAGYWRNPALTAERFSGAADGGATRLFHTGDLGRINSAGILEFAGRRDRRVKIRGNLIELSEIEDALRRLPGITHAAVEVMQRKHHDDTLLGYVVPVDSHAWSPSRLRVALRDVLPNYMVPPFFVFLDELPTTLNGKIDRAKLRDIPPPSPERGSLEQPATETEFLLADIWADVFELAEVGRRDDFFDLGGDSLIAAVIGAKIHKSLGAELTLRQFATHPMLADLASVIDELGKDNEDVKPALAPAARDMPLPLSPFQERMWKFSQTPDQRAQYTIVSEFRILGPLDVEVLRDCVSYMAGRHEILRTSYAMRDGQPVQTIHPHEPVALALVDLTTAVDPEAEMVARCRLNSFATVDLERGPLMRFTLFRLREHEYSLSRVIHHVIWDGLSGELYFQELALLYEARLRGEEFPLSAREPLQYADYAVWHRDVFSPDRPAYRAAVDWWERTLSDAASPFKLPFLRDEPLADISPSEGLIYWGLNAQTSQRLNAVGRMEGATPYMMRLAGFMALLSAKTGRTDIVIGTYVSNRNLVATQKMLGLFVNLATLRLRLEPGMTFRQWIAGVRTMILETEACGEIPYEDLCNELRQKGINPPEIQVIFGISTIRDVREFGGLKIRYRRFTETMPWGLNLYFNEFDEENRCRVTFNAHIYDPVGVREFISQYQQLLDAVSREPDATFQKLLSAIGPGDGTGSISPANDADRFQPQGNVETPIKNLEVRN